MEQELKKSLLKKFRAKNIRNKDWDKIYNLISSTYSEEELLQVMEKYDFEIIAFRPSMKSWKVKDRLMWYAKKLVEKEPLYRADKNNSYHSEEDLGLNRYRPNIKGKQTERKVTFIDEIEQSENKLTFTERIERSLSNVRR